MTSARTHCPECRGQHVVVLDDILFAPRVDFFRCADCGQLWHVEKGHEGPASYALLGSMRPDLQQRTQER
jgi:predicted Zn finger-like uncharacterized protein